MFRKELHAAIRLQESFAHPPLAETVSRRALLAIKRDFIQSLLGLINLRGQAAASARQAEDIFNSTSGRIMASLCVLTKRLNGPAELSEILAVSDSIRRARNLIPESARWRPKSNGGYRLIVTFDDAARATQTLAKFVFLAMAGASPFEYAAPLRHNRSGAIDRLCRAFRSGYTWCVVLDITGAFGSVRRAHLRGHGRVIDRTLGHILLPRVSAPPMPPVSRRLRSSSPTSEGENEGLVRHRLPEGATSSAAVLSTTIGRVLSQFSERDWVIIAYVDDIVVATRTQAEAEEAMRVIRDAFASLNGGPVSFGRCDVQTPNNPEGVRFLGYRINWWLDPRARPVRLFVRPSNESWFRFRRNCSRRLHDRFGAVGPLDVDAARRVLQEYGLRWQGSFGRWVRDEIAQSYIDFNIENTIFSFVDHRSYVAELLAMTPEQRTARHRAERQRAAARRAFCNQRSQL